METRNHIEDKVVLITGAGGGFGRILAEMTAAKGARVVVTDVDGDAATAVADAIGAAGGEAVGARVDVAKRAELDAVVALAVERWGGVDVLVNNAGIMPLAFFADHALAADAWDRAIDINLKGVVNGICAVHDQMIAQGRGHVVNISSIYGNAGTAGAGVYAATKAAVRVLSDSLRVESQGKIKVTVVRPTGVAGTGLGAGVVNPRAVVGILGQNLERWGGRIQRLTTGGALPPEETDPDDIRYWAITPEDLVRQIVFVIDQPWGVTINDITVRASGEDFVL
ncbi:SDR family oxidoreductase [Pseudonocardia ailaonensis]|uniref:SDR family oxidoreductase n=1 Tax=Pseudonocardia ailaonensis TaxID=367279 RepID=A0ABN2MIB6_9PSEU